MNKKKQIIFIFIGIILISLLIFLTIFHKTDSTLTYDQYKFITDSIIKNLVNNNDNAKEGDTVFTIYPGKKEINKYWVEEDFNAINDDLYLNKERVVYLEHNQIVSKVTFVYCQNIKNQDYLASIRVHESALENKELTDLPIIVSNSLTINGIYINVMTFNKTTNEDNTKSNKDELFDINTNITQSIQTYIINNDIIE